MTVERESNDDRIDAALRGLNESIAIGSTAAPATLRAGQVWHARWDDVFSLVFVDEVGSGNLVRVAPVRLGVDDADATAVILPEAANSLSIALSVWPELVTDIAEVVLERWVAGVRDYDSLRAIEEAAAAGMLQRGMPILNETSGRNRDRTLLGLSMKLLSLAATLPSGDGTLGELLRGLMGGSALTTKLAALLGIEARLALQILRGDLMIDQHQAEVLGQALDRDPELLIVANPVVPDSLLSSLRSFARSEPIRELARRKRIDDSEAFAIAAQGSFALAARGEKDGRDWAGRVDQYLALALN